MSVRDGEIVRRTTVWADNSFEAVKAVASYVEYHERVGVEPADVSAERIGDVPIAGDFAASPPPEGPEPVGHGGLVAWPEWEGEGRAWKPPRRLGRPFAIGAYLLYAAIGIPFIWLLRRIAGALYEALF